MDVLALIYYVIFNSKQASLVISHTTMRVLCWTLTVTAVLHCVDVNSLSAWHTLRASH